MALVLAARLVPGIAALAMLAALLLAGTAINRMRLAEKRRQLRQWALEQERGVEAAETWWRHGPDLAPSRTELRERARPGAER